MYKRKVVAIILLVSFIANAAPQSVSYAGKYDWEDIHIDNIYSLYFSKNQPFSYEDSCAIQGLDNISRLYFPKNQSLTTSESRGLYHEGISLIPEIIAKCFGWIDINKKIADYAVTARNVCKEGARLTMACVYCVKYLYRSENNHTVENVFNMYNNDYPLITKKSLTTRESANFASKFADFFETHTPWLYEHVLFPSFMSFSRQLKAHPALIILTISGCVVGVIATTTSGLFKRLSNAVSTNIQRLKDFCFGANSEEPQIQDEIDDDIAEDLIKNEVSISSSVETTKKATSSIACDPDLAECSDINEQ